MGAINEIVGNAGARHKLCEQGGQTYFVRLIDKKARAEFALRLFESCLDAEDARRERRRRLNHAEPDSQVRDAQEARDEVAYKTRTDALTVEYGLGWFEVLSERGTEHMSKMAGTMFLLGIIMEHEDRSRCNADEVMACVVNHNEKVGRAIHLVMAESFPGVDFEAAAKRAKQAKAPVNGAPPDNPLDKVMQNQMAFDKAFQESKVPN